MNEALPPGYIRQIEELQIAIEAWLRQNPLAELAFRVPREVMIIGELSIVPAELMANDDTRRCVAEMARRFPRATVFMFRVALDCVPPPRSKA